MNKKEFANLVKTRYEQNPNGRLDNKAKKFISSEKFSIRVVDNDAELSWTESYLGTSFGSTQDYGRRWETIKENKETQWSKKGNSTEQDLINEVRTRISKYPRQIDFYDKDENSVVTGVIIHLKRNGYAIYADPDEKIKVE